jgi:hypothetical protein
MKIPTTCTKLSLADVARDAINPVGSPSPNAADETSLRKREYDSSMDLGISNGAPK